MPRKKHQAQDQDSPSPQTLTFTLIHPDSSINGKKYQADSFQTAAKKVLREYKALSTIRLHCIESDEILTLSPDAVHFKSSAKQLSKERRSDRKLKQHNHQFD